LIEFIPSSQRYASAKLARAVKYRGRKDQQAQRDVRMQELQPGTRENELETRAVFA
jgi:ribosome biogenesis protein BRX1